MWYIQEENKVKILQDLIFLENFSSYRYSAIDAVA